MSETVTTVGPVAVAAAGASPRPQDSAPAGNSGSPSVPETRAVARRQMETQGRYQIRIHAETMRVITEIIDMFTGDVLMYLPPGYRPDAKPEPAGKEPPGAAA